MGRKRERQKELLNQPSCQNYWSPARVRASKNYLKEKQRNGTLEANIVDLIIG